METLGMDVKSYLPFSPEFSHQAQQMVNDLLAKKKVSGRYIAVNINASELAYERRLPQSCFKSIIDNIFDKYSRYSVVLIGSKQEKEYVQDFLNNFPSDRNNIFDFSGLLSLPELFALLKNARLVISNDSGPAQAASAFNTPLVVFFGPETPVIYGPLGDNVRIFYSGTHCSPCISVYRDKKIKCNYRQKCLTDLDINEINKAVEEFLQQ